jgi:hypothetical protein
MRITKGQLRRIIREEANRVNRTRRSRLYESDQISTTPTVDLMDQAAQAIYDRNKSKLKNIINQLETMGPNHKPSQAFINILEMAVDVIEETEYSEPELDQSDYPSYPADYYEY